MIQLGKVKEIKINKKDKNWKNWKNWKNKKKIENYSLMMNKTESI